jgi:hypothetical protein
VCACACACVCVCVFVCVDRKKHVNRFEDKYTD